MKTLIGLGCSHTQGCAFLKYDDIHAEMKPHLDRDTKTRWASEQLQEHYNSTHTTLGWLTDNITWMAKLNKLLKYDRILNFGQGGLGVESNIRNMRNYIFQQNDLSNHLVIHQVPSFTRCELPAKKWDNVWIVTTWLQGLYNPAVDRNLYEIIKNFWVEEFYAYKFIWEIYHLQELIESKGGEYRCWTMDYPDSENTPWPKTEVNNRLDKLRKWGELFVNDEHPYESRYQNSPDIEKVLRRINWLYIVDPDWWSEKGAKAISNHTLNREGLLPGDDHYSEKGNEILAKGIYNSLQIFNGRREYYERTS